MLAETRRQRYRPADGTGHYHGTPEKPYFAAERREQQGDAYYHSPMWRRLRAEYLNREPRTDEESRDQQSAPPTL
jgi:hypothetical protein